MNAIRKIWDLVLNLLFPKSPKITRLEETARLNLRGILPRAENSLSIHNIFPLFDYRNDDVRAIVWEIKYKHNDRLCGALADLFYEEILETAADMELFGGGLPVLLIPIPMSEERRRERGFNQTEIMADRIHKQGGSSLQLGHNLLIKTRHTRPQAELKRAERLVNLKEAFSVPAPESVRGRNVILIDDVSTTGATLREAADTLKKAGAREVIAFTIAH